MTLDALSVRDLRKSYAAPGGGAAAVLDVPMLTLGAGEQLALAGRSGSGKTTLLNILAGIAREDSGEVLVAGERMSGQGESARDRLRARRVGYVFQTFNLLQGLTALENVLLPMAFAGRRDAAAARAMLGRVGLADRVDYRPGKLSAGQQQRVAIARALVNRPALVLADEPTASLDEETAAAALKLMRDLCTESGAALLLVSHSPSVLGSFARVEELATLNRAARR